MPSSELLQQTLHKMAFIADLANCAHLATGFTLNGMQSRDQVNTRITCEGSAMLFLVTSEDLITHNWPERTN